MIINVKQFGAVGDGVTDDSGAIQAAIDFAISSLATPINTKEGNDFSYNTVYFPRGEYWIETGLIVRDSIRLIGDGYGNDDSDASAPTNPASMLKAGTVDMPYMISFLSSTPGNFIWNAEIKDLYLKGNNRAINGAELHSGRHCKFDFFAERCKGIGFVIDDYNDALSANNWINNYFFQAGSNALCDNAIGLYIGDGGQTVKSGTTRTFANYIDVTGGKDGYGMHIGDHDAGQFVYVNATVQAAGTGYGVLFDNNIGSQPRVSRKNHIGYLNGKVYAKSGSRNTIGWINSEPGSVFLEKNASLHYSVIDRQDGKRYSTPPFKMKDYIELDKSDFRLQSGTSEVLVGGQHLAALQMDNSGTAEMTTTFMSKWNHDEGEYVQAEIFFSQASAIAGTIDFNINIQARIVGQSLGAAKVTHNGTHVLSGTASNLQKMVVPLAFAVVDDEAVTTIEVIRNDVIATNIDIFEIRLLYNAAGPHIDGGETYNVPDDNVLFALDDAVGSVSIAANPHTIDVATNDPDFGCSAALVYTTDTLDNVTIGTITGSSIDYNPVAPGAFSFRYLVSCNGTIIAEATVSGTATA